MLRRRASSQRRVPGPNVVFASQPSGRRGNPLSEPTLDAEGGDCFVAEPPRKDESPACAPVFASQPSGRRGNPLSEPTLDAEGRIASSQSLLAKTSHGLHAVFASLASGRRGHPLSEATRGADGRLLRRRASSQRRVTAPTPSLRASRQAGVATPSRNQRWMPRGDCFVDEPPRNDESPASTPSLRASRQAGVATPSRRQRASPRGDCFVAKPPRKDESRPPRRHSGPGISPGHAPGVTTIRGWRDASFDEHDTQSPTRHPTVSPYVPL